MDKETVKQLEEEQRPRESSQDQESNIMENYPQYEANCSTETVQQSCVYTDLTHGDMQQLQQQQQQQQPHVQYAQFQAPPSDQIYSPSTPGSVCSGGALSPAVGRPMTNSPHVQKGDYSTFNIVEHRQDNENSLQRQPYPEEVRERLNAMEHNRHHMYAEHNPYQYYGYRVNKTAHSHVTEDPLSGIIVEEIVNQQQRKNDQYGNISNYPSTRVKNHTQKLLEQEQELMRRREASIRYESQVAAARYRQSYSRQNYAHYPHHYHHHQQHHNMDDDRMKTLTGNNYHQHPAYCRDKLELHPSSHVMSRQDHQRPYHHQHSHYGSQGDDIPYHTHSHPSATDYGRQETRRMLISDAPYRLSSLEADHNPHHQPISRHHTRPELSAVVSAEASLHQRMSSSSGYAREVYERQHGVPRSRRS